MLFYFKNKRDQTDYSQKIEDRAKTYDHKEDQVVLYLQIKAQI